MKCCSFGSQGPPGPIGPIGPQGFSGVIIQNCEVCKRGPIGLMGTMGPIGLTGTMGRIGLTGSIGPIGPIGLKGTMGNIGLTGPIGLTGANGIDGLPGLIGLIGPIGLTGVNGLTGPTGPIGLTGVNGIDGLTGPIGLSGPTGPTGIQGPIGLTSMGVGIVNYSEFYDLSTTGNLSSLIDPTIPFILDGPTNNVITRNGTSLFNLQNIGSYTVNFSIPLHHTNNKRQVALYLNSSILLKTVTGDGKMEICQGSYIINTTSANQILSINNLNTITPIVIPNVITGLLPTPRNIVIIQIS